MDFLIRGISKKDMDYLKSLARENSLSLNQFLLHILQEYCEQKQVHQTEKLYLNYLEEMKEITCMLLKKEEAESECLVRLEKNVLDQAESFSSWLINHQKEEGGIV